MIHKSKNKNGWDYFDLKNKSNLDPKSDRDLISIYKEKSSIGGNTVIKVIEK